MLLHKFSKFQFLVLTFVVLLWTTVEAKPKVSGTAKSSPEKETTKEQDLKALEDFGITRVVPVDPREVPAEIYPFKQNIHLGFGVGEEFSKLSQPKGPFLLVSYTLPRRYTPRHEINMGLLSRDQSFVGVRWKYEWNERTYFRPFAAAGLGLSLIDSYGLATVVQIKNYGLPIGAGFEKNFTKRQSYRMELYSFLGFDKPFAALSLGIVSAW